MKNKSKHVRIAALVATLVLIPITAIAIKNATAPSTINFSKPQYISNFASSGTPDQTNEIQKAVVNLLERNSMSFNLARIASTSHGAFDVPGSMDNSLVKTTWTRRNLAERALLIEKAWQISTEDPSYQSFKSSRYEAESWLGTNASKDGSTALVVVNGKMVYEYADSERAENLSQSQIRLVKENGNWRLDEVVAVHIGNQG